MKYDGLDYSDVIKIENEQNWRFTQLLIALIIGILAFSIQTLSGGVTYKFIEFLYISWGILAIAFLSGLARLFSFQKRLSKMTQQKKNREQSTDEYNSVINKYIVINKNASYSLIVCFLLGMAAFALFKVKNIN